MNDVQKHHIRIDHERKLIMLNISTDKVRPHPFFMCCPEFILRVFSENFVEKFN